MIRRSSSPESWGYFAFGAVAVMAMASVYWLGSESRDVCARADTQPTMELKMNMVDRTATVAIPVGAPLFELHVPHLEGGTLSVSMPSTTSFAGTTATTQRRVEDGVERTSTIFITANPSEFATWSAEQAQLLEENIGFPGARQQILDALKQTRLDGALVAQAKVDLDGRVIEVRMMHNNDAAASSWTEIVEDSPTNQWPQSFLTPIASSAVEDLQGTPPVTAIPSAQEK